MADTESGTQTTTPELIAAYEYVESMVPKADGGGMYPTWHGWALRDAFLAGVNWHLSNERERREKEDQEPITAEWFRSLGASEREGWEGLWIGHIRWMQHGVYSMLTVDDKIIVQVRCDHIVRGQVLRLLEALGVEPRKAGDV